MKPSTSEDRNIPGIWWLPDNPDERLVGTLTLKPGEGPEVSFVVPTNTRLSSVRFPELLHGCNKHGKPITLMKLGQSHGSFASALTELKYSAGYAILGIEIRSKEELLVGSIETTMQHFFEWMGRSGFQNDNRISSGITIAYTHPPLLEYTIDDDRSIKIVHSISGNTNPSEKGGYEKRLREDASIQFHSTNGFTFLAIQKVLLALRHLLHFSVLSPVFPMKVNCKTKRTKDTDTDASCSKDIEIFSGMNHGFIESEPDPERRVFQFSHLQSDFGHFFGRWMGFLEKYEEALGCYFTTIHQNLADSIQHLCLTQALEAYHGIKNQSQHLRNVTIETRVKALAAQHETALKGLIDDPSAFAGSVLANRNYYTHHNPEWLNKGAISGTPLLLLNEKLRLLFQMCILAEIGIPATHFHLLRRQLAQHIIEY
jgi:ApeA N-terminal domain 1